MLYIKKTSFGFAVCKYNEVIREFATYDEALEFITKDIERRNRYDNT